MPVFRHVIRPAFPHTVIFTRGVLRRSNPVLARVFQPEGGRPARVAVVVDAAFAKAQANFAQELKSYFAAYAKRIQLAAAPLRVPGGEAAKNDWRLVEKIWTVIERHGLSRQSYVLAIGGGAVLDLAGFAAATAHRGVRLVRLPTTSLSQADGGVGVKNAVNYFGKKNWVGAFAVPAAVVNDLDFLKTQPAAAVRGGIVEAFKVGLIRDARLARFIEHNTATLSQPPSAAFAKVIMASARRHLRHIATGGDPFELGSARPLDYGHWAAHKLEQMSGFRLSHGDAVAVGMALDARYAAACGWLSLAEAERIVRTLEALGCDPGHGRINPTVRHCLLQDDGRAVLAGLEEFRQHLGGPLTLTMLRAWGRGIESSDVDPALMRRVIRAAVNTPPGGLRRRC
ncbi:MAG TPA: 3-dehydroquinate synthase [Opitutales bacterium]|nr:3-dehydroquinate synthase [Opitutales bacterium]